MKHSCRNCHFLAKSSGPNDGIYHWNESELKNGSIADFYSPSCYQGVWDAGYDPSLREKLNDVLDKDRKNSCFFMEFHPAMLFPAAKELQKRRAENEQLKRSNLYTRIGLWISAIALFASVIFNYAG